MIVTAQRSFLAAVLLLSCSFIPQLLAFSSHPVSQIVRQKSSPLKTYCLYASTSNNSEDNELNTCSGRAQNVLRVGASVIAPVVAAYIFAPSGHAIDIETVRGGALTVASSTSAIMDNIYQTGFYQAFSLVFLSEIGDKTFFIAGLLAMKTSKLVSFIASMAALASMTIVSVVLGQAFHAIPSGVGDGIPLDDIAAVIAFAFFGIKTLKEAFDMEEGTSVMDEELAEAEETVESSSTVKDSSKWGQLASIFALVFAAEFGDRSFLSTIALSAAQNPASVAGGAIAAHAVATGIAVSGGSFVAKYVSERVIGFIGGALFIVFAITTALGIF